MAGPAEHATSIRPRRKAVRPLLVVAIVLILLAAGYVYLREYLAYHEDISSCYSDNMSILKKQLEDYVEEHEGTAPATFDELREYMTSKGGSAHDICVRADEPFVWMPEGITTDDGDPVVLMCPPNSHGWLRKYAFGLVRHGDTFRFVRVRGNRATPFRH